RVGEGTRPGIGRVGRSRGVAPQPGRAILPAARPAGRPSLSTARERVSLTIYGIKKCDTMEKAPARLDQAGTGSALHDSKSAGIDRPRLEGWAKKVGWETLLNRSGTTFRKLPDTAKTGLTEQKALALMLEQPSMIRRPVLEAPGGILLVGFKPDEYQGKL